VPDPVVTDGEGHYRFDLPLNDYRIPGSSYTVCEEERDGWTPASPACYSVVVPDQAGVCVQAPDFVNAQTRNDEHPKPEKPEKPQMDKPQHPDKPGKDWGGACSAQHVVKRGDTLSKLARHYHTSVRDLAWINHIRNPNRIYVGQTLCIP
jgi:nucleoid-associated protein YgaU